MRAPTFQSNPQPTDQRIPDALLKAVVAMVLLSLAFVTFARVTGMEPAAIPPPSDVVTERLLRIESTMDGGATIWLEDGTQIADLDANEGGFVAGVHRSVARERMLSKIEGNPPVRLVRFADGRLTLDDPATGWRVELIGFGATNRDAFAGLLE